MTTIGTAVLQVIPSLLGVTEAIEKQLGDKPIKVKVEPQVETRTVQRAGKQIGTDIGKGVEDGLRTGPSFSGAGGTGSILGDIIQGKPVSGKVRTQATKVGKEVATGINKGMADASGKADIAKTLFGDAQTKEATIQAGKEIVINLGSVLKDYGKEAAKAGGAVGKEYVKHLGDEIVKGHVDKAFKDVGDTVERTTGIIDTLGKNVGLNLDGVSKWGTETAATIDRYGTNIQGVVDKIKNTVGDVKTFADTVRGISSGDTASRIDATSRALGLLADNTKKLTGADITSVTKPLQDIADTAAGVGETTLALRGIVQAIPGLSGLSALSIGGVGLGTLGGVTAAVLPVLAAGGSARGAQPTAEGISKGQALGNYSAAHGGTEGHEVWPPGAREWLAGKGPTPQELAPFWIEPGANVPTGGEAFIPGLPSVVAPLPKPKPGAGLPVPAGPIPQRQMINPITGLPIEADVTSPGAVAPAPTSFAGARGTTQVQQPMFAPAVGSVTTGSMAVSAGSVTVSGASVNVPGASSAASNPAYSKPGVGTWWTSKQGGGYTGNVPIDQIAGVVHGKEFVVNASAQQRLENDHPGLLDYMNSNGELPMSPVAAAAAPAGGGASIPSMAGSSGRGSAGSDLGLFTNAAESAVTGQMAALTGVSGTPGWLNAATTFLGGLSISGPGGKIFGGGSFGLEGLFSHVGAPAGAPIAAGSGAGWPQSPGLAAGIRDTQQSGPQVTYNIAARDTEDAFIRAQRQERERAAAKLDRY